MEALAAPWLRDSIAREGVLASPIGEDVPISYLATRDLAAFAVRALEDPALSGAVLELGGPSPVTYREIVATLARLLGRPIGYRRIPVEAVEARQGPEIAAMIRYFNANGFTVDMSATAARFGVSLTPVERFLEKVWTGVAGAA